MGVTVGIEIPMLEIPRPVRFGGGERDPERRRVEERVRRECNVGRACVGDGDGDGEDEGDERVDDILVWCVVKVFFEWSL